LNLMEVYSPPLSKCKALIDFSNYVLILPKNWLNNERTSFFFFIKNTYQKLIWSSMKVKMYWTLDQKIVVKGPHTSMCTSSKDDFIQFMLCLGVLSLLCFPNVQAWQKKPWSKMVGMFVANLLWKRRCRLLTFRCPRQ
jgi:hypothetical protein